MELEAKKTEVTTEHMALAFHAAYVRYFNSHPQDDTIRILLSHWALETGWGKSMWCYNVGNAKAGPSRDPNKHWCYFRCNEIISRARAEQMVETDPKLVKITTYRSNGTCIVWFEPKHGWSCFRAFDTLEDGVYDHLKLIVKKFNKAWPFIYRGDPQGYSKALKEQGYYTADESSYTRTLVKVFHMFDKLRFPLREALSIEEKAVVMATISNSLRGMTEEHLKDVRQLIDED